MDLRSCPDYICKYSVMEEIFHISGIEDEQQETEVEALWEKPANDIINGIGNNGLIKPARAIWELVQNGRDIAKDEGTNLSFMRCEDEFVFSHDGQPFTNKTMTALILQMSSKQNQSNVQAGQYGTGFLTTHKFGFKFLLSGPLEVKHGEGVYYNFSDFTVDRSEVSDKVKLSKVLQKTIENYKAEVINSRDKYTKNPVKHTVFKYQHTNEKERENAREAYSNAIPLAQYVLLLNPSVRSISFASEFDCCKENKCFTRKEDIEICKHNGYSLNRYQYTCDIKDESVLYLECKLPEDIYGKGEKLLVILPLLESEYGYKAFEFSPQVPNLFLFLPLLGTERWGINFLIHSSKFVCDRDTRDSLRFIGDGQSNDSDAENNKLIINQALEIIIDFVSKNLDKIEGKELLARVHFNCSSQNELLNEYYIDLQKVFVERFSTLKILTTESGDCITPTESFFIDRQLYDECLTNIVFFDSLYGILSVLKGKERLPRKDIFLYWSHTVDLWNSETYKDNTLSVLTLVKDEQLKNANLADILEFDKYLVAHDMGQYLDINNLIPNESGELLPKGALLKPKAFKSAMRGVIDVILPDKSRNFVHPNFIDLVSTYSVFEDEQLKASLSTAISELQKNLATNPLEQNTIEAIITYCALLTTQGSSGFESNALEQLMQFYGYTEYPDVREDSNFFEVRSALMTLIKDALLKFSAKDNENKLSMYDWIQKTVKIVYDNKDSRDTLKNYSIYPNRRQEFFKAEDLTRSMEIPDEYLEIYDKVLNFQEENTEEPPTSILSSLVDKNFEVCFVGEKQKVTESLISEIMDSIKESGAFPNISESKFKNTILDIIKRFSGTDGERWKKDFGIINSEKEQIQLSIINDEEVKDSLFKLMQVDKQKLKTVAEISDMDNLSEIVRLGKIEYERKQREDAEFRHTYNIGKKIENRLRELLGSEMDFKQRETKGEDLSTSDVQNGQDMIIRYKNQDIYYVEVKCKWNFDIDNAAHMSPNQMKMAAKHSDCYALCCVDLQLHKDHIEEPIPDEELISLTKVKMDIGKSIQTYMGGVDQIDAAAQSEEVHVAADFRCDIPKCSFLRGEPFDALVKEIIKQAEKLK